MKGRIILCNLNKKKKINKAKRVSKINFLYSTNEFLVSMDANARKLSKFENKNGLNIQRNCSILIEDRLKLDKTWTILVNFSCGYCWWASNARKRFEILEYWFTSSLEIISNPFDISVEPRLRYQVPLTKTIESWNK